MRQSEQQHDKFLPDSRPEKSNEVDTSEDCRHILILIVSLIAMSALAIWLGLGPVAHS